MFLPAHYTLNSVHNSDFSHKHFLSPARRGGGGGVQHGLVRGMQT